MLRSIYASATAAAIFFLIASCQLSDSSAFLMPPASSSPINLLTQLRDTEQFVDVIERAGADESVVNGTPKRVQQNLLGQFADATSAAVFAALHVTDDLGIQDSSKNLRVLWSRAYLNHVGRIQDDIAYMYDLLPRYTRNAIQLLPRSGPLVDFQEFITSRTEFIDGAVDDFLLAASGTTSSMKTKPQIVLFGAGYDTRSLRYNGRAHFFEVDLPSVVEGKDRLHRHWKKQQQDGNGDDRIHLAKKIGYNLNHVADPSKPSLIQVLIDQGLRSDVPTLFVWEAVLFYVKPKAVQKIFDDVFSFGDVSSYCLVDSLKPAVTTSFLHEVRNFFDEYGLDVVDHNSRWGGAVHFVLASRRESSLTKRMLEERNDLPFSYLATSVDRGIEAQSLPVASFQNKWYAVAYPWQIGPESKGGSDVYSTRLWGEPLVIYRDSDNNLVCAKDACPHRSAPLSMSAINDDGHLECMYHGWSFGKGGACEHIPTHKMVSIDKSTAKKNDPFMKKACLKTYAVQEHEGLVWILRGNVLEADVTKLPSTRKDIPTYPCDTILDYNVDWQYIVENNLDSPHLFWLHDGSVPPVRSLNFVREKVNQVTLKSFADGSGYGHYGQTAGGKPKIVRFDAPNIVRHGGVSSFSEEFHIVPVAPGRTRVLLRQNLPQGPILNTILSIPGSKYFLQKLVQIWNYHIALEDYSVMQGQAHNVDDLGAPHLALGGLGDDLVQHFYRWKNAAETNDGALPFFSEWKGGRELNFKPASKETEMSSETSFAVLDDGEHVDGKAVGTYGILKNYHQQTPTAEYPPVNYKMYKPLLDLDQAFRRDSPGNKVKEDEVFGGTVAAGMAASMMVGAATVGNAVASVSDFLSN